MAVKLPTGVLPTAYELKITPDLANFTFGGEVDIAIEVLSPTSSITLNAIELDISEARIGPKAGPAQNGEVTYDVPAETATIAFPS